MTVLFTILLTSILTENFVLAQFLGICPFLGVSKKTDTALGMSLAVIFVMAASTAVCYPINVFILGEKFAYLQTIVFILVIAALVQLVEILLKRYIPALYKALGIYLPLITTNCAVLGVVLLNVTENYNFLESMFSSIGAGVGFMVAMIMFSGVRSKIENNDIPQFLKGLPITLVSASLVSLSFMGFAGIIENIFS